MQAVILTGPQAAGKTTFDQPRFASTHQRISLDHLKSRTKETHALQSAINLGSDFVVDNTNATIEQRRRYLEIAKASGYSVVADYFEQDLEGCLRRNAAWTGGEKMPVPGLDGTRKRLQPPSAEEGFDALYTVRLENHEHFDVCPFPTGNNTSLSG
ncbi:MAG: AAA family ATPase [Verrucomicrobiota bacterium]